MLFPYGSSFVVLIVDLEIWPSLREVEDMARVGESLIWQSLKGNERFVAANRWQMIELEVQIVRKDAPLSFTERIIRSCSGILLRPHVHELRLWNSRLEYRASYYRNQIQSDSHNTRIHGGRCFDCINVESTSV